MVGLKNIQAFFVAGKPREERAMNMSKSSVDKKVWTKIGALLDACFTPLEAVIFLSEEQELLDGEMPLVLISEGHHDKLIDLLVQASEYVE